MIMYKDDGNSYISSEREACDNTHTTLPTTLQVLW